MRPADALSQVEIVQTIELEQVLHSIDRLVEGRHRLPNSAITLSG